MWTQNWAINAEHENGCLIRQKADYLSFYTTKKAMVGLQIRMLKSTVVADKKLGPKTIQYKVLALEITKAHISPKIGSRWEIDTNNTKCTCPMRWVDWFSHGLREAFQIPTCWYRQRESLTLGTVPNVKTQRAWFCVAVKYGLQYGTWLHNKTDPRTDLNSTQPLS